MDKLKVEYYTFKNAIGQLLLRRKETIHQEFIKWYYTYGKKLDKFKNIHQGEDCFIIGNGPSLNKMDLSLLNSYYTFGMNKIYYMFDKVNLDLSYHVAVNALVIEQSINELNQIKCPKFLSLKNHLEWADQIQNCYPVSTVGGVNGFQHDMTQSLVEGGTVTYVALQLAYYMGFKRVFLIGVDHNFVAKGNANEQQLLEGNDPNHFDPRYFANHQWNLPDLFASETSYTLANYHYHIGGREIYDATLDGKLKIFPKMQFEKALEICRKK